MLHACSILLLLDLLSPDQQFQAAVRAQQQGQLEQARHAYLQLLTAAPNRIDALSNLGLVYGQLRDFPHAVQVLSKALAIAPGQSGIRLNLAMTYFEAGQYERAQLEAVRVIHDEPRSFVAHYVDGLACLKLGRMSNGIAELENARSISPQDPRPNLPLASAYLKAHQMDKAGQLIEPGLSSSSNPEALVTTGTYYLLIGRAREAVQTLQLAQHQDPNLAEAGSTLAKAYALSGASSSAIDMFKAELHRDPANFEANAFLGWLYLEDKDFSEAELYLNRARTLGPQDIGLQFQLGRLAREQGQYERAASILEHVVAVEPRNSPAHVLLAQVYFRLKRVDQAKQQQALANQLSSDAQNQQVQEAPAH